MTTPKQATADDVSPAPKPGAADLNGHAPGGTVPQAKTGTTQPQPLLGRAATSVAIAVLAAYIAALWLCFDNRADANWDRIVYLLSGFEAIVFVAVGAIFGTTVQRTTVATAQAHAEQATADARTERDRANQAVADGVSGRTLAAGIRSYSAARSGGAPQSAGVTDQRHGGNKVRSTADGADDSDLSVLIQLADELFPRDK
jgi:hypothetical protein